MEKHNYIIIALALMLLSGLLAYDVGKKTAENNFKAEKEVLTTINEELEAEREYLQKREGSL